MVPHAQLPRKSYLRRALFLPQIPTTGWARAFTSGSTRPIVRWIRQRLCVSAGVVKPAVVGVTVRLGRCLNLLDTQHSNELVHAYSILETRYAGRRLPRNLNSGAYMLDCAVIDTYCFMSAEQRNFRVQTVRGSYPEGAPAYPGSKIMSLAHTQIAVRDAACITSIHLVQFD